MRVRVGHRAHREALLGEIAIEQIAQPQVVVDDQDLGLASAMAAMVAGAAGAGEELVTRGCGGSRRETGCYKPPRRSHSLLTQSVHIALTATRPAPEAAARRRSRAGQLEGRHPCSRRRRYLQRCMMALPLVAAAGTRDPGLNQRQHNQQQRIQQGVESGELTRGETHRLAAEQRHIRREEARYKSDGQLTRAERSRPESRPEPREPRHLSPEARCGGTAASRRP